MVGFVFNSVGLLCIACGFWILDLFRCSFGATGLIVLLFVLSSLIVLLDVFAFLNLIVVLLRFSVACFRCVLLVV